MEIKIKVEQKGNKTYLYSPSGEELYSWDKPQEEISEKDILDALHELHMWYEFLEDEARKMSDETDLEPYYNEMF